MILDSSQYPILELFQEYTLQLNHSISGFETVVSHLYREKIAVRLEEDGFLVLTINVRGKLVMCRSGDTKWSVVDDPSIDDSSLRYQDVILKDGNFYAVDKTGRTVVVKFLDGSSAPELTVIAHPVSGGGRKKFLLESRGDLLMIDKYLSIDITMVSEFSVNVVSYEDLARFAQRRTLMLKVYKLDGDMQQWIEVTDLEDRILFVGDYCAFSVSVSELDCGGCKGNCIIFKDEFLCSSEEDVRKNHDMGLFSLENGSIGPICSYHGYPELFWPPPPWICSSQPLHISVSPQAIHLSEAELTELKMAFTECHWMD